MFLPIFQNFSKWKTWGRTWQCELMTDFYRKLNKFQKKFPKCKKLFSDGNVDKNWIYGRHTSQVLGNVSPWSMDLKVAKLGCRSSILKGKKRVAC